MDNSVVNNSSNSNNTIVKKRKSPATFFLVLALLLIIIGMGFYIYSDYQKDLVNRCSPLTSSNNSLRKLELNNSVVVDLYNKVKTNIREDEAYNYFDDSMRIYLAYRQLPNSKIYESNCNLFNNTMMEPFICEENNEFSPMAFKIDDLQLEYKKLFGEYSTLPLINIQLGSSCIGGYQYIEERGEYVRGYCKAVSSSKYNVSKELVEAYVKGEIITLKEKVRYYSSDSVPENLKNGIYTYTFKLDNNYNYAYVSRTVE